MSKTSNMSKKTYQDSIAEILLERKENNPEAKQIIKATVLAKSSRGLFVDINKTYEGCVSPRELGIRTLEDYKIGEIIDVYIIAEDSNQAGVFRLSIKKIEDEKQWKNLENLQNQNLELTISKVLKSGIEVEIVATKQIGFMPYGYLDSREEPLKSKKKDDWVGLSIQARIHELDQSKNKIILNHKVIADEHKEARAKEVLSSIAIGQTIDCTIVRTTDFGVFVDIGGIDALIPSSELSWTRFKKPSDIVKVGEKISAKVFKIELEAKRVALSAKQANPDPWTVLPEEIKVGYQTKAQVITQAEFGVFVEIRPGIEALLHKSNFGETAPEVGSELSLEVINLEPNKKRMGVKAITTLASSVEEEKDSPTTAASVSDQTTEEKEPEYV